MLPSKRKTNWAFLETATWRPMSFWKWLLSHVAFVISWGQIPRGGFISRRFRLLTLHTRFVIKRPLACRSDREKRKVRSRGSPFCWGHCATLPVNQATDLRLLPTVVPQFLSGWPAAFTLSFLEARPVKAHSANPHTLKDTHGLRWIRFSSAHIPCFPTANSNKQEGLFKTRLRRVKRKNTIFFNLLCTTARWMSTAVYNQTECFTGHSQG